MSSAQDDSFFPSDPIFKKKYCTALRSQVLLPAPQYTVKFFKINF